MKKKLTFPLIAAADLAVDAVVMAVVTTVLFTLITVGASLIVVLGIGLAILALFIPIVRGVAFEERRRAAGVYDLTILDVPRVRSPRTDGWRWVHQLWVDFKQGSFWRSVAFILVSALMSFVAWVTALALLGAAFVLCGAAAGGDTSSWGLVQFFGITALPAGVAALLAVAMLALAIGVVIGYGVLDRLLAPALLGPTRADLLRENVTELAEARESAVSAAAGDRMRVERDLHDGVQPRLVSVAMTLGMAKNKFDAEPEVAKELIGQAHAETKNAITELRQLARGIHPAVLTDRGLDAALSALAARCTVPSSIVVDLPGRATPEVEAVVYFSVAEALTNVDKHSRASRCTVQVYRVNDRVAAVVTDDGVGGAWVSDGLGASGLAGIRDRVQAAGGEFRLASPEGGPTTLTVQVPWRTPAVATEVL